MTEETLQMLQVAALLTATVIAVPLFKRLGLGAVLGYLTAGVVIGPSGLRIFIHPETIVDIAEFGVVIFLFVIGLEMKPSHLWALRRQIFGVGSMHVLLVGALLTLAGMVFFGAPWQLSFVAASGFALTSTAIVMSILSDSGEINTPKGQRIVSILVFQDLMIVPLLMVLSFISPHHSESAVPLWQSIGTALLAVAVLIGIGRWLLNPAFRLLSRFKAREVMTAAALLVVLGSGLLLKWGGLSMAMGAFLAGVLLSESSFRHQLEADVEPFRGLLLGLFFLGVGMSLNLKVVQEYWTMILAGVLVLMVTNMLCVYTVARLARVSHAEALDRAVLMSQGGEFAFVLYATAAGLDIISGEQNSRMTAVIVVSMAFTPLFIALKNALYRPRTTDTQEIEIEEPQPIILIGMGRYGQIVRQLLWSAGYRATILDLNAKMVEGFTRFGVKAYFGDAARPELLRTAGIEQAKLLIIAIDNPEKTLQITEFAQKINPNIRIVARAFDRMHSYQLYDKGVQKVMRETFASSVQTGKQALEMLGMEAELAAEVGDLYARINQDGMKAIAALYDPAVPAFRNEALNEVVRNQERRMYEEIQALLTAAQTEEETG